MNTVRELSQHLRRFQVDCIVLWGDEEHTARPNDPYAAQCENCGGQPDDVDRCWQYLARQLVISSNGPGFLKETTND